MYLGAGSAWASIAHLPEVVFLVAEEYAVFGYMLFPEVVGFFIFR